MAHASTNASELTRLAWSPNPHIAGAVAGNPHATAWALRKISMWHESLEVLQRIANNPNTAKSTLRRISRKHALMHPATVLAITRRSDCPRSIIDDVCNRRTRGGHLAAAALAARNDLPEWCYRRLYLNWPEPAVQEALAANMFVPRDVLTVLLDKSSTPRVLNALAHNPSLPEPDRVLAALRTPSTRLS